MSRFERLQLVINLSGVLISLGLLIVAIIALF